MRTPTRKVEDMVEGVVLNAAMRKERRSERSDFDVRRKERRSGRIGGGDRGGGEKWVRRVHSIREGVLLAH